MTLSILLNVYYEIINTSRVKIRKYYYENELYNVFFNEITNKNIVEIISVKITNKTLITII